MITVSVERALLLRLYIGSAGCLAQWSKMKGATQYPKVGLMAVIHESVEQLPKVPQFLVE